MPVRSRRRRARPLRRGEARSAATAHSLRWRPAVAAQALDQLGAGVIVADAVGRVVEINRTAEAVVQLEDALVIRDDRLCARRAFETAKIAKLLAGAAADCADGRIAGRILVGRPGGAAAYVLTVAPLQASPAAGGRRLAMIVVVDPERHTPSERDLAEFYGLSPAEARLGAALLAGRKLSDIARNSGTQVTTLRTQLSSILRKVGVSRQLDLVRVLAGIGIGSISFSAGWLEIAASLIEMAA